jgi:hypothetical protein
MKLSWLVAAAAAVLPSALAQNETVSLTGNDDGLALGGSSNSSAFFGTPKPGQGLWVDTVTYCNSSRTIDVGAFNMVFWKNNGSASVGISIASKLHDLKLKANVYISAYGMEIKKIDVDLCELLGKDFCGVSEAIGDAGLLTGLNFSGKSSIPPCATNC